MLSHFFLFLSLFSPPFYCFSTRDNSEFEPFFALPPPPLPPLPPPPPPPPLPPPPSPPPPPLLSPPPQLRQLEQPKKKYFLFLFFLYVFRLGGENFCQDMCKTTSLPNAMCCVHCNSTLLPDQYCRCVSEVNVGRVLLVSAEHGLHGSVNDVHAS